MPYPTPANEAERNEALRAYRIMDTAPEIAFTELGELAAQICECPVSYVSFIEDDRFWMKAKYGLPEDFEGCPREIAFCSVTVCGADLVYSPNLIEDETFRDFHFVKNEPNFRFYCAMPLITPEGYALGTICVMDFQPRELSFEQREAIRRLGHQIVGLLEYRRRMIELDETMRDLDKAHAELAREKTRTEELLARVLPEQVAAELKENGRVEPRFHRDATILFADIRRFSRFAETAEPATLIGLLDSYFGRFDEIMAANGVEKLKTIGDAYLAVAGIPASDRLHALRACLAALAMQEAIARKRAERERLRLPFFEIRIGLHTGPLIAGVVGQSRFTYDVWGHAVNVAEQMESHGEPGRINVSEDVRNHCRAWFDFTGRGEVTVKHAEPMRMFFLDRLKPEFSADAEGRRPNDRLIELCRGPAVPAPGR